MFVCLFFGDSLALGTADAVNARLSPPCEIRAVTGSPSTAMLRWRPPIRTYDTAILSVGSNDNLGPGTPRDSVGRVYGERRRRRVLATIGLLRQRLPSRRVIWLLPYERARAAVVRTIAVQFGDEVLDLQRFDTRDGIHPASYGSVAKALLRR